MTGEYSETCACGRVLTLADHASSSPNTYAKCREAGDQAWADEAEAERRELIAQTTVEQH